MVWGLQKDRRLMLDMDLILLIKKKLTCLDQT